MSNQKRFLNTCPDCGSRAIKVNGQCLNCAGITIKSVYKNTKFIKRDYDCSNVVACEALNEGATVSNDYVLANESVLAGLQSLYVEANVRYYGYL